MTLRLYHISQSFDIFSKLIDTTQDLHLSHTVTFTQLLPGECQTAPSRFIDSSFVSHSWLQISSLQRSVRDWAVIDATTSGEANEPKSATGIGFRLEHHL